jgi:hypothetical protein
MSRLNSSFFSEKCGTLTGVTTDNKLIKILICNIILLLGSMSVLPEKAQAVTDPVLGVASNFQIVSGAAITLGGAITGLDSTNLSTATPAVDDLRSAIASLSAKPGTSVPADLGGRTYQPGTYVAAGGAAFAMTTNVILDGKSDCASKFIFITPAAMNTTAGISITLINEAKASNVFWVVGGAITTGASNKLIGNFLSSAAMTIGASASIDGRFLALAAITVGASAVFLGFPIEECAALLGGLSISVPESIATRTLNAGETVVIEMGSVLVTDTRGFTTGASWDVSTVTEGVRDSSGNTLGGGEFSYSLRDLTQTGGLTLFTHVPVLMTSLAEILSAKSGLGRNSATWTPVITVIVPINQVGGTYTGSITHSVS